MLNSDPVSTKTDTIPFISAEAVSPAFDVQDLVMSNDMFFDAEETERLKAVRKEKLGSILSGEVKAKVYTLAELTNASPEDIVGFSTRAAKGLWSMYRYSMVGKTLVDTSAEFCAKSVRSQYLWAISRITRFLTTLKKPERAKLVRSYSTKMNSASVILRASLRKTSDKEYRRDGLIQFVTGETPIIMAAVLHQLPMDAAGLWIIAFGRFADRIMTCSGSQSNSNWASPEESTPEYFDSVFNKKIDEGYIPSATTMRAIFAEMLLYFLAQIAVTGVISPSLEPDERRLESESKNKDGLTLIALIRETYPEVSRFFREVTSPTTQTPVAEN